MTPPAGSRHVPSLDGLRAVAVVLVVLFHLRVPGFDSGFLGVDMFFVLSGFLITSLLVGEHGRRGRISLANFWSRRVRRLMPALVLVLLAVAIVTGRTATMSEKESIRGDLLATTFYVANWHFVTASDYFNDQGIESPLEHTWSLAIEEQFYFFWPLAAFGLLMLGRRWPRAPATATAVAVGASALLLARLWEPDAVERAYMGTDARVFEPLIGALAALLLPRPAVTRALQRFGPAVAGVSAVALAGGVVAVARDPDGYFTYGALVVSLATAGLVTACWVGRGGVLHRVLEPGPVVWVGALSYGIYLWHWPWIVWLDVRSTESSGAHLRGAAAVVLFTLAASSLSYYFVERPIRGGVLTPFLRPARIALGVPVLLTAVAGASILATRTGPPPEGTPIVMITGDSVPARLVPFLERAAERRGWFIVSAARGGCGVTGEHILEEDGSPLSHGGRCPANVHARQDGIIAEYDPDVVVWWDRFSIADFQTPAGRHIRAGSDRFWELRRRSLETNVPRLRSQGARVAFVGTEPPGLGLLKRCRPGDCAAWHRRMLDDYDTITTRWNRMMARFGASRRGATFVSITDTVCRRDLAPCDDRIDGELARSDGTHYVGEGAEVAADAILDELQEVVRAAVRENSPTAEPAASGADARG